MYPVRSRPRPILGINSSKRVNDNSFSASPSSGALSPDVRPNTLPLFPVNVDDVASSVKKVGKYLIFGLTESGEVQTCRAICTEKQEEFVCKVLPVSKYQDILSPYWVVGSHPNLNNIEEILLDSSHAFVLFAKNFEDLHSFVRRRRRLKESEAFDLFRQIVSAVSHCHENGVILRDLKLRKFVFKDSKSTHLVLDNLEDSHVLSSEDEDLLTDKHGCPAYVSPEILFSTNGYSGKAADVWSLGVVFYTMLAGQYPFHDADVSLLFKKIRHGCFSIPDSVSSRAKCLIKNLLRTDPTERLQVGEILEHPWFNRSPLDSSGSSRIDSGSTESDQKVPEVQSEECRDLIEDLFNCSWQHKD